MITPETLVNKTLFSTRAKRVLFRVVTGSAKWTGYEQWEGTLRDVAQLTPMQIMQTRGAGKVVLNEARCVLRQAGLQLKCDWDAQKNPNRLNKHMVWLATGLGINASEIHSDDDLAQRIGRVLTEKGVFLDRRQCAG